MTLLYITPMPPMTLGLLVLALIVILLGFVYFVKRDSVGSVGDVPTRHAPPTVDDLLASYGEPKAMLTPDVTRGNDPDAVVLVYDNFIIVGGEPIEREKITHVTFFNSSNPYVTSEYCLSITTCLPDRSSIEVPIGSDAEQAKQITAQLAEYLQQ